jgi:hypothetical protein
LQHGFDEEHGRRHGYTAPIERDLHTLLHPEKSPSPSGNDAMKLGRSFDVIVHDFDTAKDAINPQTRSHIVDIDAESRINRAGGFNQGVA